MWGILSELFSTLTSDELTRDKVLTTLTSIGLILILALYLAFLFSPVKREREVTHNIIVLREAILRKFKRSNLYSDVQWQLRAKKMNYDEDRRRSLILRGILSLYSEGKVTIAKFSKAFSDERLKQVHLYSLEVLYEGETIYAVEGELIGERLYLRSLRIVDEEGKVTLSPTGLLYQNKLTLREPVNVKVER